MGIQADMYDLCLQQVDIQVCIQVGIQVGKYDLCLLQLGIQVGIQVGILIQVGRSSSRK